VRLEASRNLCGMRIDLLLRLSEVVVVLKADGQPGQLTLGGEQ
jgi:hypothetical protein